MVQQLHRKIEKIFLLSILFGLTGCPFVPPGSNTTVEDELLIIGNKLDCAFRISYKNCGGIFVDDSLGQSQYSEDLFLFSPSKLPVINDFDITKFMKDFSDTGIKLYGFEKGTILRAMLLSHYDIRDTYDIIGEEFYDKMGPFGDNDFTEEEFTTLLQRVDDYDFG